MNAATNLPELTVSELAFALKRTIEDSFGLVRVRGELSGYKRASSGHVYFALKDEQATLDAVLWRGSASKLSFVPEDGLEVVCTGRLTTYPGRSRYQLVVDRMEPAGLGALMAMLEERRRRLTAEGLFDPARKRPLPFLPEVIGVVTSPTGAVIRDILHRLADRFPRRVILWPVPCRARGGRAGRRRDQRLLRPAARRPGAAAGRGDRRPRRRLGRGPVGVQRGGGGPRRRGLAIPLISAVGHETDITLIDHAADTRAPTPTAAAELAVPVRRDLLLQLGALADRQEHAVDRLIASLRERADGLVRGLARPQALLGPAAQRLDDLAERLELRSPARVVELLGERLEGRAGRLRELARDALHKAEAGLECHAERLVPQLLTVRLDRATPALEREAAALERLFGLRLERHEEALDALARQLESLSHRRVLERGYAIVRGRSDGHLVPSLAALGSEAELEITFADGQLPVRRLDAPPRPQRQRGRDLEASQGRLL